MYYAKLNSPLGKIIATSRDGVALSALEFEGQKYARYLEGLSECEQPVFKRLKQWLEAYFAGKNPTPDLPLDLKGTPFQLRVWEELKKIPYGTVTTYGQIAAKLNSSPRAVGGAVGRNPVSLIMPCHRVVGGGGKLTGFAGGLDKKEFLLNLEGILHK